MQGTQRSEIRLKVGENVAPPGFDQIFEVDTLFPHEEEEMHDTHRSEIRPCESEKVKKLRGTNRCKNVAGIKNGENVVPPGFDQIFEGDTLFPREEEEMQGTQRSEIGPCESEKVKKVRGTKRYKKVVGLIVGEKLPVIFYHNIFYHNIGL
uniref:Uncharacterized protein isoform X2 n=1 Tax=Nicotiana tabacum TaxID=4097 RepID=A0A1S4C9P5_TOBAC|nr:PREDICTED: uncharacterized protein LOC107816640 isoform X2 [Nicotiana tabacum]